MILATELLRPQNMQLQHEIPLDTLVEVVLDGHAENGIRGFVVEHTRDCDGEPLYAISLKRHTEAMNLKSVQEFLYCVSVSDGWTKENLKLVKENA